MVEPFVFGIDHLRLISTITQVDRHPKTISLPLLANANLNLLIASTQVSLSPTLPASHLTHCKLHQLLSWMLWEASVVKQLDAMEKQGMYGPPCIPPPGAIILWSHWPYINKPNGGKKSHNCCDGSKKAAPQQQAMAQTYSSCLEQPAQLMFFTVTTARHGQLFHQPYQCLRECTPSVSTHFCVH
jgi:hypothetical protein